MSRLRYNERTNERTAIAIKPNGERDKGVPISLPVCRSVEVEVGSRPNTGGGGS